MKKWITILCSLLCAFSLAACAESESDRQKRLQKEDMDNYKVEAIEQNFGYYVAFVEYLTENNYVILSNYNNEEVSTELQNQFGVSVDGHGFHTAMESFHLASDTTGSIKTNDDGSLQISNISVKIDGNQIIANGDVACEKKNAQVELIFSNDIFMKLEGGSLNAKASMGELMEKAALNTLIGMSTVFMVLILISLIIACFGFIPKIQDAMAKKAKEKEVNTEGINNAVAQIAQHEEVLQEETTDDTELVAVIAAAIAAYEGSTNTEGFVVRSIRRRY